VSADNVVIMFHDPVLHRKTNSTGQIQERTWYGDDGMQHVRTIKEPIQSIPTFAETVALLMKPENQHVKFNVDVKVRNDPDRLFTLMHEIITAQPDWQSTLSHRIVLGLWHPRFIAFAKARLPYCRRSYIGKNTYIARKYFWNDCDAFSIAFMALTSADGEKFRADCKSSGKSLIVWTVNDPDQMMEAVRWGVTAIITDVTKTWLDLRSTLQMDYEKIVSQHGRSFLWTTLIFYTPIQVMIRQLEHFYLETLAGPFDGPA